ncbi:3-carboxyethylcatechol 2,3-dioxygenase [Sphingomonas sp.]|uniref:3-carboxyethylcatechol 2,3-dioxygenase n=1 Tax=Sphingomonas sp. TaxID=28214 RepID=UPI003B00E7FC
MIVGSVCLSHSPLKDRNRADPAVEARFDASVRQAAEFVEAAGPDVAVIFYPDHVNGFFYGMLPPFCVGIEATSIGDYGTAAGALEIPEERALDLAESVLGSGVDIAISYSMKVDHGAAQPLEWLSERHPLARVIPIFVNCAAPPLPTFQRVRALGAAVGAWAERAPERVLIIGSGGLSHDPPVPAMATAPADVRSRLIAGGSLNHAQRYQRQNRAHGEGSAMARKQSSLLPANPDWDRMVLDALAAGDLAVLDAASHASITSVGGRGGHEVRTWMAALAALGPDYAATELFYEAVDEWITGMGVLQAVPA